MDLLAPALRRGPGVSKKKAGRERGTPRRCQAILEPHGPLPCGPSLPFTCRPHRCGSGTCNGAEERLEHLERAGGAAAYLLGVPWAFRRRHLSMGTALGLERKLGSQHASLFEPISGLTIYLSFSFLAVCGWLHKSDCLTTSGQS